MSQRGKTIKTRNEHEMTLERPMVTRHYVMTWDLDRCVGCQMGPTVCPKDALTHIDGEIIDGRLVTRPSVDVDPEKCIFCGICVETCSVHAIDMKVNGKHEIPVIKYEAFPEVRGHLIFNKDAFDFSLKDFVIDNCPTNVISYDEEQDTMVIRYEDCIRCRQCEVASKGAFQVIQRWQGSVELHRERCIEGCLACTDVCPTRALHINEDGELVLADYYCIKCGACMHACPIKPEFEDEEFSFESQGMTITKTRQKLLNKDQLAIKVERWRANHSPVKSASWIEALGKLADDKASAVEIDRKRALRRRDLIRALRGHTLPDHTREKE
ncbi:MAG: 4Fe-4S binding protein [Brevefilum sp.]|nr:4Fe-4S binding protein [Brevefilum sp.]MDT8380735.1 4Fe-4S binding protein [Brevefilum sp.]MDW7754253.1 4Fe-4S binding protein [Brevefilum sp.]